MPKGDAAAGICAKIGAGRAYLLYCKARPAYRGDIGVSNGGQARRAPWIWINYSRRFAIAAPINRRSLTPPVKSGPRFNQYIQADQVRVIDENGENIGVLSTRAALDRARDAGLDLVEISPNVVPPVCKILDVGKFRYEAQKKANAARKTQKTQEIKEIKMRPNIDDHDYETKTKAIVKFITNGDKVKVTLRFKGREMSHQQLGMQLLQRLSEDMAEVAKVESHPRLEGRQMLMVLAPK